MSEKKKQPRRKNAGAVRIASRKTRYALRGTQEALAEKLAAFTKRDDAKPLADGLSIDPTDLPLVVQAVNLIERLEELCAVDENAEELKDL